MHMHVYSMHMHLSSSGGSPMRYENKVVLITGGGGGIGRAAAQRFLDEGARVVLSGTRHAKLEAARDALDPSGGRGDTHARQVPPPDPAPALVAAPRGPFGRVGLLVNPTGLFRIRPFPEQTEEPLQEAPGSIPRPAFWGSQAAAAAMRDQGDGG